MEDETFAPLLRKAMDEMHMGAFVLSRATAEDEAKRVPTSTINGWLKGRRPQSWQQLLQVAAALGRDSYTTNRWLASTEYAPLETLVQQHPLTDDQRTLIEHFLKLPDTRTTDELVAGAVEDERNEDESQEAQDVVRDPVNEGFTLTGSMLWSRPVIYVFAVFLILIYGGSRIFSFQTTIAREVTVDAAQRWQPASITVHEGQQVKVRYVRGTWSTSPDMPSTAADGYSGNQAEWTTLPTANLGSLIMRIGNSAPILIGRESTIEATASGGLFFQINDGNCPCYDDNAGFLVIRITVQ